MLSIEWLYICLEQFRLQVVPIFGLKQIAEDWEDELGSEADNFVRKDFFVDDGLRSHLFTVSKNKVERAVNDSTSFLWNSRISDRGNRSEEYWSLQGWPTVVNGTLYWVVLHWIQFFSVVCDPAKQTYHSSWIPLHSQFYLWPVRICVAPTSPR